MADGRKNLIYVANYEVTGSASVSNIINELKSQQFNLEILSKLDSTAQKYIITRALRKETEGLVIHNLPWKSGPNETSDPLYPLDEGLKLIRDIISVGDGIPIIAYLSQFNHIVKDHGTMLNQRLLKIVGVDAIICPTSDSAADAQRIKGALEELF